MGKMELFPGAAHQAGRAIFYIEIYNIHPSSDKTAGFSTKNQILM
jgi:hypothetical protein